MSATLQSFHGELVKMVTGKWISRVLVGFEAALKYSFETDGLIRPVMTRAEIERRFGICTRWFVTLRRDCKWSVPRILDELPTILRKELDGERYEPIEDRQSWVKETAGESLEVDVTADDMAGPVADVAGVEAS